MIAKTKHLFSNLRLGDLVETPSGDLETVRAVASVGYNIADVEGLCILGSMNAVLLCRQDEENLVMLVPVQNIPQGAQTAQRMASGLVSFWAPHMPAIGGALCTAKYEIMMLMDTRDLFVMVTRGKETIFFNNHVDLPASAFSVGHQKLSHMNKDKVSRYAAVVSDSYVPFIPQAVPQKVKSSPRKPLL